MERNHSLSVQEGEIKLTVIRGAVFTLKKLIKRVNRPPFSGVVTWMGLQRLGWVLDNFSATQHHHQGENSTSGVRMVWKTEGAHIQAEDRNSEATTWMVHPIWQGIREVQNPSDGSSPPEMMQFPLFRIKKNYCINCSTEKEQFCQITEWLLLLIKPCNHKAEQGNAHSDLANHQTVIASEPALARALAFPLGKASVTPDKNITQSQPGVETFISSPFWSCQLWEMSTRHCVWTDLIWSPFCEVGTYPNYIEEEIKP